MNDLLFLLFHIQAHFLRHEGYLGAIGAFLKGAGPACLTDDYSWTENLYGSSSFSEPVLSARYAIIHAIINMFY